MTSVADGYSHQYAEREWRRLASSPYHELEFTLTMHFLRKHLPPQGVLLDAGGGPGRYTLALCRLGYQVELLDIAPGNIDLARANFTAEPEVVQACLRDIILGDVRDLSRYADGSFDAVLCLGGPLSHIPEPEGRQQAVTELVRVTKPGSIVVLTGVGYLAVLRTIMMEFSYELVNGSLDNLLADGNTCGPAGMRWHFMRAEELRNLAESCGLTTLEMAGLQSLSTGLEAATNALRQDEAIWQRWMELLLAYATDPAVVDMAEHILYVGRKKLT